MERNPSSRAVAVGVIAAAVGCAAGCAASHRIAAPSREALPAATGPAKAHEWRRLAWRDQHGSIDADALRTALQQRRANLDYWAARAAERGAPLRAAGIDPHEWVPHGPVNVGGRTRSLVIHPAEPNRMWAGAVSGGVWCSEDYGATWTPINDWWASLAIGCLVIDPQDPQVMYAGTGEGYFNGDAIGGAGIFRSPDGGASWQQMVATADWDNVCRISIAPDNSDVLLAGIRYGGIRRSDDGGHSWTTPYWAQGSYYVAFDPADGQKAIAHVVDYDFDLQDWFHSALYSTDGGVTWSAAAGALGRVDGFGSRLELAYAPGAPDLVYASSAADGTIWRSTDGGQRYVLQTESGSSGANWYANPLWIDPVDAERLLTGGYHVYESVNGGVVLSQKSDGYIMTDQPHVDIHWFAHDPAYGDTNRRVYVGTDGGLWVAEDLDLASPDGGWTRRDQTYRTTQFYGAAGDGPSGLLVGGTQDNGTLRLTTTDDQAVLTFGGDGGFCAIDPTNSQYTYGEYISLMIHRSTNGGFSASYIYAGIDDAGVDANFIAPYILDPNDPARMLAGGRSLWRTQDVKAPAPQWLPIRGPGSDRISAIAVAPGDSNIIWVGQNNGEIHRTNNGLAALPVWEPVDDNGDPDPLPDRYVTRIVIDPDDSDVAYVSLGGFTPDNLWRTTDGGATWADISGAGGSGLPGVPIRGIARHPQRADWLYAGTEVGVFASGDGGATWSTSDFGPAAVSVDEVVFMHGSNTLLAATHGRGLFTIETGRLGDLNGDGVVNVQDFLMLLSAWGPCPEPPAPCPADLDGDGTVGILDFLLLLANWG
jgi:photosystem II stability/assembly factor-like uncharacterized protein